MYFNLLMIFSIISSILFERPDLHVIANPTTSSSLIALNPIDGLFNGAYYFIFIYF